MSQSDHETPPGADDELPHGGTPHKMVDYFAKSGALADVAFGRLSDEAAAKHPEGRPPMVLPPKRGDRSADPLYIAHLASYGTWGVVRLLKYIEATYGAEAFYYAAAAVEDLGVNGGDEIEEDAAEAAGVPALDGSPT